MEIGTAAGIGAFDPDLEIGRDAAAEIKEPALSPSERRRFDQLYRGHKEAVMRTLRARLSNEDDIAELMQEAYLRLLRYRHCGPDSLKYLLFRVALNLAVSHQRQAGLRKAISLDDVELAADELPIEDSLMHEQEVARVALAIQALPPRCRQMYVLSRLKGLRQREIARHCGISTRMVELHIARAQLLIREQVVGR